MDWFYNLIGGGDEFTEADCKKWLDSGKTLNPRTNRKIGPTQNGKGPYHDLENLCLEKGFTRSVPIIKEDTPLRLTKEGTPILRNIRKSPAISATSVPIGTKMEGQDGTMYIVKARSNGQYWQPCIQKTANC